MQCWGEGEVKALYIASIMLRLPVELFSSCNVFGTGRFTCCMNPKTSTMLNNIEQFGFEWLSSCKAKPENTMSDLHEFWFPSPTEKPAAETKGSSQSRKLQSAHNSPGA